MAARATKLAAILPLLGILTTAPVGAQDADRTPRNKTTLSVNGSFGRSQEAVLLVGALHLFHGRWGVALRSSSAWNEREEFTKQNLFGRFHPTERWEETAFLVERALVAGGVQTLVVGAGLGRVVGQPVEAQALEEDCGFFGCTSSDFRVGPEESVWGAVAGVTYSLAAKGRFMNPGVSFGLQAGPRRSLTGITIGAWTTFPGGR